MDPRPGLSVLMSFKKRIDYLRRRWRDAHTSIVYMMSLFLGWNARLHQFSNNLMEAARVYTLNQSGRTQLDGFESNVEGILKVIRDCSEHPAKSFEQYMLLIIEEDFHSFAALLQFAMFRAGQLQYLNLDNSMG
jgi:hypothetical protein